MQAATARAHALLAAWGVRPARLQALTRGPEAVWRVLTQERRPRTLVLRLYPAGPARAAAIDAEAAWLRHAAQQGLHVPRPQALPDGRWRHADAAGQALLLDWLPGRMLFKGLRPVHLHRAGVFIAQLHDSAQALQAQGLFPPAQAAHGAELSRLADHGDRLRRWGGRRLQHAVDAAVQRLALQQRHWPRDDRHRGWIHGDLHPWNLLFADGRAGAIDFSDGGWGWLAQDLAAVLQFLRHPLAGLADHRPQQPRLREALLAGYASVRPWPRRLDEQVDALHAQRLLNTVCWMADDWASPAERPWGPAFLAQLPTALSA